MKKLFLAFLFVQTFAFSFSQPRDTLSLLYLIPFYTEDLASISLNKITSVEEIDTYPSFQLTGFWEGALMALDEHINDSIQLRVIVKDITHDSLKLKRILKDTTLMNHVDIIIGPFYSSLFEIAIRYAKTYSIPIVNPFSNRKDFIKNNPPVFKVIPAPESHPQLLSQILLSRYPDAKIVLWTDKESTPPDIVLYENFFTKASIPYTKIPFIDGIADLIKTLSPDTHNIIIVSSNSMAATIHNLRNLAISTDLPSHSFVIPEKFIRQLESELDNLNKLQVMFFSNYYIQEESDELFLFKSKYIERFFSPPSLARFSYQGYDITRYFLYYLIHQSDTSRFEFSPLSLDFDFLMIEDGGWENQKVRLLQLNNYKFVEIKAPAK